MFILLVSTCLIIGAMVLNESEILLDRTSYQGMDPSDSDIKRQETQLRSKEIINVTVYSGSDTVGIIVKLTNRQIPVEVILVVDPNPIMSQKHCK